jgi:hypothetical protein
MTKDEERQIRRYDYITEAPKVLPKNPPSYKSSSPNQGRTGGGGHGMMSD